MQILFLSSRADATRGSTGGPDAAADAIDDGGNWRRYQFRLIYDAHHDDLWRYCLRRSASVEEAEEALSETFTVAWRRLDEIPKGDGVRPWLFGVARNNLRSGWRRYRRNGELHERLIQVHVEDPGLDPATTVADESGTILTALGTLKERDQEILRLAVWEELPHVEIAQLIGCSENAVAIRLHRARGRLAAALTKVNQMPTNRPRNNGTENVKGERPSAQVKSTGPDDATQGGHR